MKKEPIDPKNFLLTPNVPLNVKEEPLGQSKDSLLTNNILPLCIKKETLEHCQSFPLSQNQPLYIKIEYLEESQNCTLTTNAIKEEPLESADESSLPKPLTTNAIKEEPLESSDRPSLPKSLTTSAIKKEPLESSDRSSLPKSLTTNAIKEEPLESSDRSFLPKSLSIKDDISEMTDSNNSVHINTKEQPIQIVNNSVIINKTNVTDEPLVLLHASSLQNIIMKKDVIESTDATENNKYVPLKMEIEENSESHDPSVSSAAVSENGKIYPKIKNDIICNKIPYKKYYRIEKKDLNSRVKLASHSISSITNANCNKPVFANNGDYLVEFDSRSSLTGQMMHKNTAQSNVNASPDSYILLPLLTPSDDGKPSYVQYPSTKSNATNSLLINSAYNSQYLPNSPQASNPEKNIYDKTEKRKVMKHKSIWEIRHENTVLRGIDNESLKRHLLNPSDNFKFQEKIIHNEPIITRNALGCSNNDVNLFIKPALVKSGKVWEVREGKNVMRGVNKESLESFFPKDSDTVPFQDNLYSKLQFLFENTGNDINTRVSDKCSESTVTQDLLEARMRNTSKLKNKQDQGKCNSRNKLQSLEFDSINHPICMVKGTKFSDQRILNAVGESTNQESLTEIKKENASQFQNESSKGKSDPESLYSSLNAQKSKFFAESMGTSINVQNPHETQMYMSNESQSKQYMDDFSFHDIEELNSIHDMKKHINKDITTTVSSSKAKNGGGALVYDRINTNPQKSALTKLLEPLYKYLKDNKCLLCGFESKSTDTYNIRRHLLCHLPNKNFSCDTCGKMFSSPEGLSAHKTNVHCKDRAEVSCKECDKKFSTPSALNTHRRTHHEPSVCLICNNAYKSSSALKEHYRVHTGEKPYVCVVCNEAFRTRGILKNHSLKHKAEKLYSCSKCDKSYNNKGLLNEHMNSHEANSDIKCDICGKTFNYKSNLYQHMLVHLDSRPHKCETCGLTFKLSHHLKSHISTHH